MLEVSARGANSRLTYNQTNAQLSSNLAWLIKRHSALVTGHPPTYPPQIYLTYYEQFLTMRVQDGHVVYTNQTFYDMMAEYLAVGTLLMNVA